jgi:hypothetical protein
LLVGLLKFQPIEKVPVALNVLPIRGISEVEVTFLIDPVNNGSQISEPLKSTKDIKKV